MLRFGTYRTERRQQRTKLTILNGYILYHTKKNLNHILIIVTTMLFFSQLIQESI